MTDSDDDPVTVAEAHAVMSDWLAGRVGLREATRRLKAVFRRHRERHPEEGDDDADTPVVVQGEADRDD